MSDVYIRLYLASVCLTNDGGNTTSVSAEYTRLTMRGTREFGMAIRMQCSYTTSEDQSVLVHIRKIFGFASRD